MMSTYHTPVLLQECMEALFIQPNGVYVDVTYGAGGYSKQILRSLEDKGRLFAFDQDEDALVNKIEDGRFTLLHNNFKHIKKFMQLYGVVEQVDGIVADLGISSHQIDEPSRGFSTRYNSVLDMRMDKRKPFSAVDILNGYEKEKLYVLFREYGEMEHVGKLVAAIERHRANAPITTGDELKQAIASCFHKGNENKFLAQVYQALRIEVNDELGALKDMLEGALACLKPGGRLVVVSYHSLEDRLVKNFIKTGNFAGILEKDFFGHEQTPFRQINRKIIVPSTEELERNTRARSAKLRIAEKK